MCGRFRYVVNDGDVLEGVPHGAVGAGNHGNQNNQHDQQDQHHDDQQNDHEDDQGASDGISSSMEQQQQDEVSPRENFGPGMKAKIVVMNESGQVELKKAQWGLIRSSHRKPIVSGDFFKMFNARSDRLTEVHDKLLGKQHCVVCCNGFYEWRTEVDPSSGKEEKQPYYVFPKSKKPLYFAGLYDEMMNPEDGQLVRTFTVITVDVSSSLKWLHNRMPAVLSNRDMINDWLNVKKWNEKAASLLQPDNTTLTWHPVTKGMGSTKFQEPTCAEPVQLAKPLPKISQFFSKKTTDTKTEASEIWTKRPTETEQSSPTATKKMKTEEKPSPKIIKSTPEKQKVKPKTPPKGQKSLSSFFAKKG